jgi:hypothetical protein
VGSRFYFATDFFFSFSPLLVMIRFVILIVLIALLYLKGSQSVKPTSQALWSLFILASMTLWGFLCVADVFFSPSSPVLSTAGFFISEFIRRKFSLEFNDEDIEKVNRGIWSAFFPLGLSIILYGTVLSDIQTPYYITIRSNGNLPKCSIKFPLGCFPQEHQIEFLQAPAPFTFQGRALVGKLQNQVGTNDTFEADLITRCIGRTISQRLEFDQEPYLAGVKHQQEREEDTKRMDEEDQKHQQEREEDKKRMDEKDQKHQQDMEELKSLWSSRKLESIILEDDDAVECDCLKEPNVMEHPGILFPLASGVILNLLVNAVSPRKRE